MSAVNIIGFNAPEWHIAFMGSVHAHNLPVGIYTTYFYSSQLEIILTHVFMFLIILNVS